MLQGTRKPIYLQYYWKVIGSGTNSLDNSINLYQVSCSSKLGICLRVHIPAS